MQRAWYRRGRQCQHIDLGPQSFQSFLVLNTEALLLVDDDKAEFLELHVRADEPMRADHHVDAAVRQPIHDATLLSPGAKSTEAFDDKWVLGEPFGKGPIMLFGQDRGRYEDGDLFAIVDRLERGADSKFRLTIPDVTTDE